MYYIGEISYSARLYRSLSAAADFSAVFCMCPYHAFYTQVYNYRYLASYELILVSESYALLTYSFVIRASMENTLECQRELKTALSIIYWL